MKDVDLIIVGSGIFGLTIAERAARKLNKKVLIVEKRDHIGGNSYSETDPETGIECHKYGAHIFHTSNQKVWEYVNNFANFTNYQHRVYSTHNNEVFPLPINLGTINQFFHKNYTPDEARNLISIQSKNSTKNPQNLKEQGISLIGKPLFEAFIMNYTAKQWQTPAEKLSPEIIKRLPVRYNYNNRYFSNTYEGLPKNGYNELFKNIVNSSKNIRTKLSTDYFKNQEIRNLTKNGTLTIFTGPIDQFFNYKFGALNWRSVEFKKEIINTSDFQGCPVMNYADLEQPYTRIIEFKHFHPERTYKGYSEKSNKTIIYKEFSKKWNLGDEPYYPVRTEEDLSKLKKYQSLAKQQSNIIFGGRLGEYAYYDMDATFASALKTFESKIAPFFNGTTQ
ncbi:MAG: UDP-galactopyranose mutase [Candidatus Saccharibacteria bacterium]|nr:UDP-galactopyranose mutase [Candidatus Saccharibacteria bacterium]